MERLPVPVMRRVGKAIDNLAAEPKPNGCKKLKASKENLWRIRVGDYRVIYLIADEVEVIDVRRVRNRKDVYE